MTPSKKQEPKAAKTEVKTEVKPEPAAPAATPTKQETTLMKLSVELAKRDVTVKPEMLTADGKFLLLNIGPAWPTIRIGAAGGIELPQIRSYPKAFEAACEADKLWEKQQARDQKKVALATAPATKPEVKKEETAASKKEQQHAQIEKQIEEVHAQ